MTGAFRVYREPVAREEVECFVLFPLALWEYMEVVDFFYDLVLTFPQPAPNSHSAPINLNRIPRGLVWCTLLPQAQKQGLGFEEIDSPSEKERKKKKSSTAGLRSFHTCFFSKSPAWVGDRILFCLFCSF